MKKIYGICVALSISIFSIAYYTSYQIIQRKTLDNNLNAEAQEANNFKATPVSDQIVRNSTIWIKEIYHSNSYRPQVEEEESVPQDILGLTQEEVEEYLEAISDDEKQYELLYFSDTSVKIKEIIQKKNPEFPCYLVDENGYLLVYNREDETYLATYLATNEFPQDEQEELMSGKGFPSLIELYNYLESHTS
ncbi:hypothetical protein FACS189418_5010 [Clostridia bacterium]|nr:hypothetical protein FACS189418_5010 [Clostridia bacterium]